MFNEKLTKDQKQYRNQTTCDKYRSMSISPGNLVANICDDEAQKTSGPN